jgi:hypothetical protein
MGHVLAVPEQAIVVCNVCNGYMIHIMKPLDVSLCSSQKKSKVQSPIWHILDSNRANQPLCKPGRN